MWKVRAGRGLMAVGSSSMPSGTNPLDKEGTFWSYYE
jgi:hypothetical protein